MSNHCHECNEITKSTEKIVCSKKSCVSTYHYICVNLTPQTQLRVSKSLKGNNCNMLIRPHDRIKVVLDQDYVNMKKSVKADNKCSESETVSEIRNELINLIKFDMPIVVK